jgi:N-methylhydantoinase A
VTDANLVLGRLQPQAFLGGAMSLDVEAATMAVTAIAEQLQISLEAAAQGIITLANEHMAQALRVISVQRGIDPRPYRLVSFGGAGGLHVCALAEALGMRRALVPVHAGVLSALGMLAAPRSRQLSRTLAGVLADFAGDALTGKLQALAAVGTQELIADGVAAADIETDFSLDLRYQGQSYTLNLPWQGVAATSSAFHAAHEQRYGHRLAAAVELVNLRCGLQASPPPLHLPQLAECAAEQREPPRASLAGVSEPVPVWSRSALCAGQEFTGPALVTETVATTWLPAGWRCRVDPLGNLLLENDNIQTDA